MAESKIKQAWFGPPDPQHILRIHQQAVEFELEDIREGRPLPFPYGR